MSLYATVAAEIHSAEEQDRPIAQIRVTTDAIQGSITAAPVTPERARTLGQLMAIRGDSDSPLTGTVVSDPSNEQLLEILIHPEDWRDLLTETGGMARFALKTSSPGSLVVRSVLGIPVEEH